MNDTEETNLPFSFLNVYLNKNAFKPCFRKMTFFDGMSSQIKGKNASPLELHSNP